MHYYVRVCACNLNANSTHSSETIKETLVNKA